MQKKQDPLIFVVEDNPIYSDLVSGALKEKQFKNIRSFKSTEECLQSIHLNPDIIVLNYAYSGFTGLDLMREVHKTKPQIIFIFLSGQNSVEIAVKIIRQGAFDYIVKGEKAIDNLISTIQLAMKIEKKKTLKTGFRRGEILFFSIVIVLLLLLFILSLISKDFNLF